MERRCKTRKGVEGYICSRVLEYEVTSPRSKVDVYKLKRALAWTDARIRASLRAAPRVRDRGVLECEKYPGTPVRTLPRPPSSPQPSYTLVPRPHSSRARAGSRTRPCLSLRALPPLQQVPQAGQCCLAGLALFSSLPGVVLHRFPPVVFRYPKKKNITILLPKSHFRHHTWQATPPIRCPESGL